MTAAAGLKRIVVGVDGSEAAAAALAWAGRLARRVGAEVVVAHAFQPEESEVPLDRYDELQAQAETRLAGEWTTPLTDSGAPYRILLLSGAPDVLLNAAETEHADLLVVGPRGHGRFAGLHIGSVAHYLARHTTRPLAIVPAPRAATPLERIVIGVDGSPGSMGAARWCARLAVSVDAEVIAVCALEPHPSWWPEPTLATCEERLGGAWTAPLHDAGVKVRPVVRAGTHPVEALSVTAIEEQAGLVAVGAKGIGGFLGLRLGRVPAQLVHHTQLPVVIVPAPSAAPNLP
jgi:nucleotide-binding universal stress UspA family protein